MASEPRRAFQRHDPSAWVNTLAYRDRAELPYSLAGLTDDTVLMLDATVYVDAQKAGHLPPTFAARLADSPILHSSVALGEIAAAIGLLNPHHSGTPTIRLVLEETLARAEPSWTVAPSSEAWQEAAMVAGILARTQGVAKDDRRKLLNDALILMSAAESDAVLISRNKKDIDLLLRFRPDARVVLYDRAPVP